MTACPNPTAAVAALLAEAEPLIRWHVRNARVPDADRDDVKQDVRVKLWHALKNFDPSKPQPLKCFVQAVIRKGLASYRAPRGWRLAPLEFVDRDDLDRNPAPDADELPEEEEAEDFTPADDALLDRIAARLKPTQAAVFKLVALDGLSVAQAAEQMGYTTAVRSQVIFKMLPGIVEKIADLLPPAALAALSRWQAAEPPAKPRPLPAQQRRRLEHLLAGGTLAGSEYGRGATPGLRDALNAIEKRLTALGTLTPEAAAALARGRAELAATDAAADGGPTFAGIGLTIVTKRQRELYTAVMAGRTLAEFAAGPGRYLSNVTKSAAALERILRRRGRWSDEAAAAFQAAALTTP